MTAAQASIARPAGGWLRAVRQALGFSQASVSAKAGITQQAYAQFETGEVNATISLGRLRHAAAAMDCDLVYFLVPRRDQAQSSTKPATGSNPHRSARATEHRGTPDYRAPGDLPVELL